MSTRGSGLPITVYAARILQLRLRLRADVRQVRSPTSRHSRRGARHRRDDRAAFRVQLLGREMQPRGRRVDQQLAHLRRGVA